MKSEIVNKIIINKIVKSQQPKAIVKNIHKRITFAVRKYKQEVSNTVSVVKIKQKYDKYPLKLYNLIFV